MRYTTDGPLPVMIKTRAVKMALVLLGILLALALVEAGVRIHSLRSLRGPGSRTSFFEFDETVGWRLIPGAQGLESADEYAVRLKINSKGLRDIERDYRKEEGVFRIVVLGDSFMEAYQVPLEASFSRVLESELNAAKASGRRIEVVNLGIRDYGTAQEYLYFLSEGLKYHPDLVLLAFFPGNDVRNNSRKLENGLWSEDLFQVAARPFFEPDASSGLTLHVPQAQKAIDSIRGAKRRSTWRGFFAARSLAYRLIAGRIERRGRSLRPRRASFAIGPTYGQYSSAYSPEWEEAWRVTKGILAKWDQGCRKEGIPLVVFSVPSVFETDPPYREAIFQAHPELTASGLDVEKPERILAAFAREEGFHFLALLPRFRRQALETGERLHFFDDGHWNERGHASAAGWVARYLIEERLLGSASPPSAEGALSGSHRPRARR